MHGFSIEYLTGNTAAPSSYNSQEFEPQTKQHYGHAVTTAPYYPAVHLEDVYSVLGNDATVSGPAEITSALELPSSEHCVDDVDRGTPSPHRDSGIESDHSPGHVKVTPESIEKTLIKLERTAAGVKTRGSSAEKPGHSYLALIAKAILSSPDRKLTLGDIYRHIMDNNPFYDNSDKAWRGSIRYTLSINECFIKDGKDESGKGNFWAIHPACLEDFEKGDYRRRQARRRAKRNVKTVSSYPRPAAMTSQHSAYTPMTSAYVYSPYAGAQPQAAYPHVHQNYSYGYTKPEPEATRIQHPAASANPLQPHPAFGYSSYPGYASAAAYGYMYQDYSTVESAYKRELEKIQQQYETTEAKRWSTSTVQSDSSPTRGHSPDEIAHHNNEIHIV